MLTTVSTAGARSAEPSDKLSIEDMKQIVSELARVKSQQDVEAALAIYHLDGTLLSPPMGACSNGAAELRRGLEI